MVDKQIIASLPYNHVVDIVRKLLIETKSSKKAQQALQVQLQNEHQKLTGQSLIIVRNKDNLEQWARNLHEKASLSIINHAVISLNEQKQPAIASTCASFDVVITTFDAIKSPDVVVALNDDGHVVLPNNTSHNASDGSHWLTSRRCNHSLQSQAWSGSSDPKNMMQQVQWCKQMCILHHIKWQKLFLSMS